MKTNMILIIGVTASGKGKLAFELAQRINAEIISVDAMKVYRRMDIGTAKPPEQALKQVKYHLIDVIEPSESFNVAAFLKMAGEAIQQIRGRNKPVIAVGGTALYVKSLLYGLFEGPGSNDEIRSRLKFEAETAGLWQLYDKLHSVDPLAAERIHKNDAKRIIRALEVYEMTGKPISDFQNQWNSGKNSSPGEKPLYPWMVIGLRRPNETENKLINRRVKQMVDAGLVDEVNSLLAEEKSLSIQARQAIGYAEIIQHLKGEISLEDAVELIKKNTRRLAKSQRTWFKRFADINWLDIQQAQAPDNILKRTIALL